MNGHLVCVLRVFSSLIALESILIIILAFWVNRVAEFYLNENKRSSMEKYKYNVTAGLFTDVLAVD